MSEEMFINRILEDEGLTSNLDEAEVDVLNPWLIGHAKNFAKSKRAEAEKLQRLEWLCQQGRNIARLVAQFRDGADHTKLVEQARQGGVPWPEHPRLDSVQLLKTILELFDIQHKSKLG